MKNFPWFLCCALVGALVVLLLKGCGGENIALPVSKVDSTVHHTYDSTVHHIFITKKTLIPEDSVKVPVPIDVDTIAILEKYFTKYYYSQTYRDSLLEITVNDTVGENKILDRFFSYKIIRPSQTTIIKNSLPKDRIFIGLNAGVNINGVSSFGPGVMLARNNNVYSVGYDLRQKAVTGGFYFNPF